MTFRDRTAAGQELAVKLAEFVGQSNPADFVIAGLPRGGVTVALEIARRLQLPLDILTAKKLPFPGQPEYAIGAVSSDGVVVLSPEISHLEQWQNYVEEQRQILLRRTRELEDKLYSLANCQPTSMIDKTVILVDDGIATGMTALAAIESAKRRGAKQIILASPVMSKESYRAFSSDCRVLALSVPEEFGSVGQHYLNFTQLTDEEVISALRDASQFAKADISEKTTIS